MNKDKNKTRPVKTSGRKVVKKEYGWGEVEKKQGTKKSKRPDDGSNSPIHLLSEEEIKNRYRRMQKEKELKAKRVRAILIFVCIIMLVVILAFMTPIFNIRTISVEGNSIVSVEEIDAQIGDLVGENLFRTGSSMIEKRLKNIAYVDEVSVSKRMFLPSVKVSIKECQPAGYIMVNGVELIINSELKILDDSNRLPTDNIPEITGLYTSEYDVGKTFESDESEKDEALRICLSQMEENGLIQSVNKIDIESITGIEFVYQDRINVLCGTQLDLGRKLSLFRETILSNNIGERAKGTIDLTVTGKAVYTP